MINGWALQSNTYIYTRTRFKTHIHQGKVALYVLCTRDNSLELLQPMTANPISFEFSRVLRYVTSKGIRQTVLDSTLRNAGKFKRLAVIGCNSSRELSLDSVI